MCCTYVQILLDHSAHLDRPVYTWFKDKTSLMMVVSPSCALCMNSCSSFLRVRDHNYIVNVLLSHPRRLIATIRVRIRRSQFPTILFTRTSSFDIISPLPSSKVAAAAPNGGASLVYASSSLTRGPWEGYLHFRDGIRNNSVGFCEFDQNPYDL